MKILILLLVTTVIIFVLIPLFIISCFVSFTWNNIKKGYIILFAKESK